MSKIFLGMIQKGVTYIDDAFVKVASKHNFLTNTGFKTKAMFSVAPKLAGDVFEKSGNQPIVKNLLELTDDALRADIDAGLSLPQLVEKYSISMTSIRTRMKALGIKTLQAQRADSIPRESVEKLINSGADCHVIAQKYGITEVQVGHLLKKWGLETDIEKATKMISKQDILDMQEAGVSNNSVLAEIFGIPEYVLSKLLREFGLSDNTNYLTRIANDGIEITQEALEKMLKEGKSRTQIAEEFGVTMGRITKKMDEYGLDYTVLPKRAKQVLPDNFSLSIMLKKGVTLEEIADDYDISVEALKNHIKKEGILAYKNVPMAHEKISDLAEEGYSVKEIAKKLNMKMTEVRREIDAQGISIIIPKEKFMSAFKIYLQGKYKAKPEIRDLQKYFGLDDAEYSRMWKIYYDDIQKARKEFYKTT